MKFVKSAKLFNTLAGISALGAVGTLTLGGTWALFSAEESSASNSFVAGTVSVGPGSSASTTCTISGIMPGDSSAGFGSLNQQLSDCAYRVKYTGSAGAYLAVDIAVSAPSAALPTTPGLYNGAATGLQLRVAAGSTTFLNGTTYKVQGGTDTVLTAGTPVANLLVSTTPAATDDELTFDIRYALPTLAPNSLQGGSATVTLTFRAVQSANQDITDCTAGRQCDAIAWS